MRRVLIAVLLVLCGCTAFSPPPPTLQRHTSVITVKINPNLATEGWASWQGGVCTITLRKYPICLAHEVRHCLEGDWHPGSSSGEDC